MAWQVKDLEKEQCNWNWMRNQIVPFKAKKALVNQWDVNSYSKSKRDFARKMFMDCCHATE